MADEDAEDLAAELRAAGIRVRWERVEVVDAGARPPVG